MAGVSPPDRLTANATEPLTFRGEGHGFRRPSSITRALEAELSLYLDASTHAPSAGHPAQRGRANRTRPA